MQKSFWWWQPRSDRYIISFSPHLHTPIPPFSLPLISLMVSVDVKHHVYLLKKQAWRQRKCANISICRLCLVVLSTSIENNFFFASNLSSPGHSHAGFLFTHEEQKLKLKMKGWPVTYLILFPHILTLSMLLIEAAGLKTAAFTVILFQPTFKCQLLTNRTRNQVENCCVTNFPSLCSHQQGPWRFFASAPL